MDAHQTMTTLLTLIAFLGGWVMNSFRVQLADNRKDIEDTRGKLHEIEVLVAGKYMTREEAMEHDTLILNKLDTIQKDIRSCMLRNRRKDDSCEP